jgi:hypothetical protein
MVCVWCDTPSAQHDLNRIGQQMENFAKKNPTFFNTGTVDFSSLDAMIATIPNDLTLYTDDSVANLNIELAKVDSVKASNDQAQVDMLVITLGAAIKYLTLKPITTDETMRVFSIDAGRKYFTKDQLIEMIDTAYKKDIPMLKFF